VADADFVIEAACNDVESKRELFARLDALAPAHAVLATYSATVSCDQPRLLHAAPGAGGPGRDAGVLAAAVEQAWRLGREPLLLRRGAEPEVVA